VVAKVAGRKDDCGGDTRCNGSNSQEHSKVETSGPGQRDGDQENVSDDGHETPEDEKYRALSGFIGQPSGGHSSDKGENIRWRREKQRLRCRPFAQTCDDGWRKDTLTVDWHGDTDVGKHERPHFPVHKGALDNRHVERSLRSQSGVGLEPLEHHLPFEGGQELGVLVRPILHKPRGCESSNESEETFNDEDPGPSGFSADTVHSRETVTEDATEGTVRDESSEADKRRTRKRRP
jgi:hypothetical protein